MTTFVHVSDLHKRLGSTQALDGVSLTLGDGITGLLGPNGAGKTTLIRILATVLAPDAGTLRPLGADPADRRDRALIRARLGYMPQEPGFHQRFTAFEFIDYVAILKEITVRRERHDEVRRVLELVGLGDVAQRKIKALSSGMRRRVALAQALLGDPLLVILDEPTAGLDPEQRLRFRELISRLAEDRSVLISTHQTEDVSALCHHLIVLDRGRSVFAGAPRELADVARDRVWLADARSDIAKLSWLTGDGRHRHVGDRPPLGAELVAPTLEDGYLLLLAPAALKEAA
ncbi:MAG: ABC transporter ATP-binding protein [Actinobacteria bacterium]|nr:ABC transporter ATP-binding protein [Actinomycetota bacterium]